MEEWREIEGFTIYEVSNLGRVRNKLTSRVIGGHTLKNGYIQVGLMNNKKQIFKMVHRLVSGAFIGRLPEGKEINHIDGNKTNNCVDNLEYVTHSENMIHCLEVLCKKRKISKEDAVDIRKRLALGEKYDDIASDYNVVKGTIRFIARGVTYRESFVEFPDRRIKLSNTDITAIRRKLSSGDSRKKIAQEYFVSSSTIDNIANKKHRFCLDFS